MHISHPAKVGLVVLRLEPTAQSLGGRSCAPPPPAQRLSAVILFPTTAWLRPLLAVACLLFVCALCTSVDLPGFALNVTSFAGFNNNNNNNNNWTFICSEGLFFQTF